MVCLMPVGAVQKCVIQIPLLVIRGHGAVHQSVDGAVQVGIGIVDATGIITALGGVDFRHSRTENVVVFHTCFLDDFHIGTVQCAQGHSTVEHQLHIAGAGGLCACRGDLLGNVGGRNNVLRIRAVIVLHKNDLQLICYRRIVVDHKSDAVDIADNGLGTGIAGCGFCTEQVYGGLEVGQLSVFQAEVDVHDGQSVQQLTLVFVKALNLHIEHKVGIQLDALLLFQNLAKLLLLGALDGVELTHHIVVNHALELADAVQIGQEVTADAVLDHLGQLRVAQTHPATGGHTVGLILEAFRIGGIPILKHIVLQNLRVNLCHAIDVAAHIDAQVCHVRGMILYNEQVGMLASELAVQAENDVHDLRYHTAQQIQIPLLQRLTHNGVVGVGEGLLCHFKGLFKGHTLCHQQTDQLRNGHCRVGVVELNGVMVGKVAQVVAVGRLIGANHILQGGRGQHILLLNTQALALPSGVVGVEDTGNVFCLVLLRQGAQIVLIVKGVKVQFLFRFTLPQTECAHVLCAIADHRHVVGDSIHGLVGESDLYSVVIAAVGPGVTVLCPVVGGLHLRAVLVKLLLKQAEAVTQAVAGQRNIGAGGRI